MGIKLTDRMKAWIESGCHLCVADKNGNLFVTLARNIKSISDDDVIFALSKDEYSVIKSAFEENPWVAFGVSRIGGVRACYQFKGKGSATTEGEIVALKVILSELYCTKPGCYAGLRLDSKSFKELEKWESDLWKDLPKK